MAVDVQTEIEIEQPRSEIEIERPRSEVAAYAADPDYATSW